MRALAKSILSIAVVDCDLGLMAPAGEIRRP
jgi:hypothetical protein